MGEEGVRYLQGIAASNGYAIAKALVLREQEIVVPHRTEVDIDEEILRFRESIDQSIHDLQSIYDQAKSEMGEEHAEIFEAHIMMLNDPELIDAVIQFIGSEIVNAEYALDLVAGQMVQLFESMEDAYMRERAADIRDITQRVMKHLLGVTNAALSDLAESVILIAHDLTPSDTAQLDRAHVIGFATNIGGRTSHSAIMARSLEIPAVVGLKEATEQVENGSLVILDGVTGTLILHPTQEEISQYEQKREKYLKERELLLEWRDRPSTTIDGHQVELAANIGTPADLDGVVKNGAEGIGLFRSEFLYLDRNEMPSEEEQFEAYRRVAEGMNGKAVIIRTLDIGGDKELPYLNLPKERNPFLGYRAIRLCLDQPTIFKTQLRAILRSSHYGNVKIMYPMISTITEVRAANQMLYAVKEELSKEGVPFNPDVEVGIMIEIPAAALLTDLLAREVDFFSLGTNDLIQYSMASDRMNEKVSYLYQPYHPSILRLIKLVIDNAHQHGKWVGMCGEMAGDPIAVPILLGLGLDEFSMSASSILSTRRLVHQLKLEEMKRLAEHVLSLPTQEEIKAYVENKLAEYQI